jgi:hypothetical protein
MSISTIRFKEQMRIRPRMAKRTSQRRMAYFASLARSDRGVPTDATEAIPLPVPHFCPAGKPGRKRARFDPPERLA